VDCTGGRGLVNPIITLDKDFGSLDNVLGWLG